MSAKFMVRIEEIAARLEKLEDAFNKVKPKLDQILEIQRLKGGRPRKNQEKDNGKIT